MDKFLETYNFPRLNKEEIENINRPIISNEGESVINKHLTPQRSQPLRSPALPSETHTHCTRLSSLAQAEWKGEGLFLFGFKRYNSSALTCIYSFFLPSGHLLFLLLPSAVINICIPLTSRQPKACPKCVTVPVLDSLTWWWGNRVFISSCPWLHSTERGVCFMVPCN